MTTEEATKLDLLVLSYCHFAILALPQILGKHVDCLLNMPHHGLTRGPLYDELIRLVEREWLELHYGPRVRLPMREMEALRATGWVEPEDLPDDEIMEKGAAVGILRVAQSRDSYLARHIRIAMTEAGGAVWGRFVKPQWHLFVDQDGPDDVDGRVQFCLRTPTRRMAHFARDLMQQRGRNPWQPDCYSICEIGPWEALPWKKFKRGFALRIDSGAQVGTRLGEVYSGGLLAVEGPTADLVGHLCSLWDLEFHKKLLTLRRLPVTFQNYLR
jgi:hypothetical protein